MASSALRAAMVVSGLQSGSLRNARAPSLPRRRQRWPACRPLAGRGKRPIPQGGWAGAAPRAWAAKAATSNLAPGRLPAAHALPRQRRLPNQPLAPGRPPARPVTSVPSGAAPPAHWVSAALRSQPSGAPRRILGAQRPEHHHRNQDPEQGDDHIQAQTRQCAALAGHGTSSQSTEKRERRFQ